MIGFFTILFAMLAFGWIMHEARSYNKKVAIVVIVLAGLTAVLCAIDGLVINAIVWAATTVISIATYRI